jgi:hypothetical protein
MHKIISDESKNLIIFYPYPMGSFIYQLYDIEKLSDYYNVIIYDFSNLVAPGFTKFKDKHKLSSENLFELNGWIKSYREIIKLIKKNNLVILYELRNEKFGEFILRLIINKYKKKYNIKIYCYVGGVIPEDEYKKLGTNILKKIIIYIKVVSCVEEFILIVKRNFIRAICRSIKLEFDFILAGGNVWKKRYLAIEKNTKIVDAHSHDFSKYLSSTKKNITFESESLSQAIFLDSGSPMFLGDYVHIKTKSLFTKEKWYPALCKFFEACEETLKVKIKIAGHYKTDHESHPNYFNGNEVLYGKTNELIKNSKLVIAVTSTAISYAVAHRKPVVFIYNDELKKEFRTINLIKSMANSIGSIMINIDDDLEKYDFHKLLNININLYQQYEKQYLTCNRNAEVNADIIKKLIG